MSNAVVDLWLCPIEELDESEALTAELKAWLTDDEIAKVSRYKMERDRLRGLYVRCFLRAILSRYANRHPNWWRFEYGDKGKPRLSADQFSKTGIEFNISHSRDYLLVAVCLNNSVLDPIALGVDIEHSRDNTNIQSIMTHYFSHLEIDQLMALDESQQSTRFFDLWALKESYIKATGTGLATSLKGFSFDFSKVTERTETMRTVTNSSKERVGQSRQLLLFQGLELHLFEGPDREVAKKTSTRDKQCNNLYWKSLLGRVDDQYRFAVTLGAEDIAGIKLNMNEFQTSDLFSQLEVFKSKAPT